MRLSYLTPLGLAAMLGIMTLDAPDANALVKHKTVVSKPHSTTVVTKKRPHLAMTTHRWHGARGSVVCHTLIKHGKFVHRCI
jgi:hypothetical protein